MPRTQNQNKLIKQKRRFRINKAALKLFALNGYDTTTINDITKESNCSHGLFYHYYPSKESLFIELMNNASSQGYVKLFPSIEEAKNGNPELLLYSIIDVALEGLRNSHSMFSYYFYLFLTLRFQKTIPLPKDIKCENRPMSVLKTIIEKGQKENIFAPGLPHEYAITFFGLMRGITFARIHLGKDFVFPSREIIMNLFLKAERSRV
jgi:AcrR family transcriptional regulator